MDLWKRYKFTADSTVPVRHHKGLPSQKWPKSKRIGETLITFIL